MLKKQASIFIIAILLSGSVFSASQISKEDLLNLEYEKGAGVWGVTPTMLSEHFALIRFPVLAYATAFEAEAKNIVGPDKKELDLSGGIVTPATNVALTAAALGGSHYPTGGVVGNAAI